MEILITLFWIGFWIAVALFVFNIIMTVVGMAIMGIVGAIAGIWSVIKKIFSWEDK